jgi:hypothetical protein
MRYCTIEPLCQYRKSSKYGEHGKSIIGIARGEVVLSLSATYSRHSRQVDIVADIASIAGV